MAEDLEFLKHVATRRELFRTGAAGVGSLALNSMLAPEAFADQVKRGGPHFAPRAKRIIFLFMNGAPSQHDLFDFKPLIDKYHGKELFKTFDTETKKWSEDGLAVSYTHLTLPTKA